jgi:hypothetical protein
MHMATGASYVSCHIPGIDAATDVQICDNARNLVNLTRESGKPAGVILIEYFEFEGAARAQVHFVNDAAIEQLRPQHPQLTERF